MSCPSQTPSSFSRTRVQRLPSIRLRRAITGELKPFKRAVQSKFQQRITKIRHSLKEVASKLEPWRESVKAIEGHHGSGVASYFLFLRWSVSFNFCFFWFLCIFIVIPQTAFEKKGYTKSVLGINSSYVHANDSQYCSQLYILNTTTNSQGVFVDFLQGTGWMEKTPMFYGYYEGKEVGRETSYIFPLAYLLVCISCLIYSIVMMAKKSASNIRDTVYEATYSSRFHFSTLVFLGWDYTMADATSAKLRLKSLKKQIISELAEKQYRQKQKNMTNHQYTRITVIRILVNIFVILCLSTSAYVIYVTTQYTAMYVERDDFHTTHEVIGFVIEYLPTMTISALNGVIPILFSLITIVEDYLPQNEVIVTLVRTILIRLASLIFLVASLYEEVRCTPRDSCNVGMIDCPVFRCWETYIGQQFYKLIILDFFITCSICLIVDPLRKLLSIHTKIKLIEPKFDVPRNVLDLVYTQSLSWLGFFFVPLLPWMVFLKLFFTFYLKKFSALEWCAVSEKPYKASKSESLFAIVLMMSFFLCCLPIIYVVRFVPPSRGCGPFRVYSHMYDILTITVELLPLTASVITRFVFTSAFLLTVIIIMTLCLYHCAKRGSAQNETIELLRSQLSLERRENLDFLIDANKMITLAPGSNTETKTSTAIGNGSPTITLSTIYIDDEEPKLPKASN